MREASAASPFPWNAFSRSCLRCVLKYWFSSGVDESRRKSGGSGGCPDIPGALSAGRAVWEGAGTAQGCGQRAGRMRVNRGAGAGSVPAGTARGSPVLGKEGGSLLWSPSPFPGEEVTVCRGELPAVPLLSEWPCLCWLRRALTCPSLSAISLTMSSLGVRQASSVTS